MISKHHAVFGAELARESKRQRTKPLIFCNQLTDSELVALSVAQREQRAHFVGARGSMRRGGEALEAAGREGPQHTLVGPQRIARRFDDGCELLTLHTALGEPSGNDSNAREAAGGSDEAGTCGKCCRNQGSSAGTEAHRGGNAEASPRTR